MAPFNSITNPLQPSNNWWHMCTRRCEFRFCKCTRDRREAQIWTRLEWPLFLSDPVKCRSMRDHEGVWAQPLRLTTAYIFDYEWCIYQPKIKSKSVPMAWSPFLFLWLAASIKSEQLARHYPSRISGRKVINAGTLLRAQCGTLLGLARTP